MIPVSQDRLLAELSALPDLRLTISGHWAVGAVVTRCAPADAADRHLHHRWTTLDGRGKRATVTVVAVARELAGW